jgi:hypothetical protein
LYETAIKAIKIDSSDLIVCSSILYQNRQWRQKAQPTAAQISFSPPENIWYLLRKTKEKAARTGDNFQFSTILAHFYNEARTYFQQNA